MNKRTVSVTDAETCELLAYQAQKPLSRDARLVSVFYVETHLN